MGPRAWGCESLHLGAEMARPISLGPEKRAGKLRRVLTIVKLMDVNGEPKVKIDLPGMLRVGDPVALRFRIERKTGGRSEVLEVQGKFCVAAVGLDASRRPHKQLLSVESAGALPTWRSVKRGPSVTRRLGPARHPRTSI